MKSRRMPAVKELQSVDNIGGLNCGGPQAPMQRKKGGHNELLPLRWNNEQILAPITIIRAEPAGLSFSKAQRPRRRGLKSSFSPFGGRPTHGHGWLGGDNGLMQMRYCFAVTRSDADVDYTFVQIFPDSRRLTTK